MLHATVLLGKMLHCHSTVLHATFLHSFMPQVIDSTLTFNDSSKFVVLVSDNATSSWTANLVVYQASSSTCTTPTDYALDNCGSLGCGLESSMIDSTYCLLRLSNGNNYDSSTFNFQCLLPCTVLTASYFANLVSIYVPNAVGKLKNIVAGCNGDSTLSSARRSLETAGEQEEVAVSKFQIQATASGTYVEWLCTSYSTSAATTICNEVDLQFATLSTVNPAHVKSHVGTLRYAHFFLPYAWNVSIAL